MAMDKTRYQAIYDQHTAYWEESSGGSSRRLELARHYRAYMTRFWQVKGLNPNLIQVANGFTQVEGYVAALFARAPAVVATPGLQAKGNPEVAQEVASWWLVRQQEEIERATRLGLIFPGAAIRVFPDEEAIGRGEYLSAIRAEAIPPWDLVVDPEAALWSTQRFVGSVRWLPLQDAVVRWGKDGWNPTASFPMRYLSTGALRTEEGDPTVEDPDVHWVRVMDIYEGQRLVIWSPDNDRGVLKEVPIPFKDYRGLPVVPIVPLFFDRDPQRPMRGYSLMQRIYDQIRETNIMRTGYAAMVRQAGRIYLSLRGAVDPEGRQQILSGEDGVVIDIDGTDDVKKALIPLAIPGVPVDLERYQGMIQADLSRDGILAPFVHGQATGASATEVTALASYSAGAVQRFARVRDRAIEDLARVYLAELALYLPRKPTLLSLRGKTLTAKADDLLGDFTLSAQDQAHTPLSTSLKKRELAQVIPLLLKLGVPKEEILKEIVRIYDLPDTWAKAPEPPATGAQPIAPQPGVPHTAEGE